MYITLNWGRIKLITMKNWHIEVFFFFFFFSFYIHEQGLVHFFEIDAFFLRIIKLSTPKVSKNNPLIRSQRKQLRALSRRYILHTRVWVKFKSFISPLAIKRQL